MHSACKQANISAFELFNVPMCRCKQAEILAGVCGQREALERRVYEQDVQLELSLDELETSVQVSSD